MKTDKFFNSIKVFVIILGTIGVLIGITTGVYLNQRAQLQTTESLAKPSPASCGYWEGQGYSCSGAYSESGACPPDVNQYCSGTELCSAYRLEQSCKKPGYRAQYCCDGTDYVCREVPGQCGVPLPTNPPPPPSPTTPPTTIPTKTPTEVPTKTPTIAPTKTKTPTPTKSRTPTPPQCVNKPVDIILALDRSSSMSGSKLNYEKNAAKAFVDIFNAQGDVFKQNVRIGAVSWDGNWNKVTSIAPTNNYSSVKTFINNIKNISGDVHTCIECGVKKAADLLTNASRRRIVVIMSDGIGNRIVTSCNSNGVCTDPKPPTCNPQFSATVALHCPKADATAIETASKYKASGISYYVVGYGSRTSPLSILESTLRGIGGSNYIYGGTQTNWAKVFAEIAGQICSDLRPTATPTKKPTRPPVTKTPTKRPTNGPSPTRKPTLPYRSPTPGGGL